MAASASDYFQKVGRSTATTLSSPGYTIGNTSINIGSTANMPTTTGVHVAIDEVDSSGARIAGTYNVFRGVVSSATQISSLVYVGGDANRDYTAGANTRVYITVSSYRENRLVDGLLVEHAQDGTHKISQLLDTNGNELLKFTQTSSAVNELTIKNNSTGNAPELQATGGDTNIGINFVPKGTGEVQISGTPISGAWNAWTPTLSGRLNNTKWTKNCAYKQVGKIVTCRLALIANAATPMDGGTVGATFTLPVTSISYPGIVNSQVLGTANLVDAGSNYYSAVVQWESTTVARLGAMNAASTHTLLADVTSTVPMVWVSGDEIHATFTYEAA